LPQEWEAEEDVVGRLEREQEGDETGLHVVYGKNPDDTLRNVQVKFEAPCQDSF